MTKGQLLRQVGSEGESGSMELTKWFAFFGAKADRDAEDKKHKEWEQRVKNGG